MLVKSSLSPSFVSLPTSNLEFLIISVKFRMRSLFIGTFYRPPSSLHDLSVLYSTLQNLRHSVLSNLILVGDFNVHYSPSSSSSLFCDLKSIAVSYSLSQVITDPTHFSHSDSPSIIDLVFLPSTFSSNYAILPPVSSSDHNSILLSVSPPSSFHHSPKPTRRRVWLYSQADLSKINNLLSSTSLDLSSDIDAFWLSFKSHFLKIMHTCIPSKLLPDSPLPPWINRSLAAKMRTRQRLYRRAISTRSPSHLSSYRSLRNHITSSLKHSFFHSLSHAAPSKFWSFVKSLRKSTTSIPTLSSDGTPIESDLSKAQCLNEFFTSCFNSSAPPLSPIPPFSPLLPCPDELLCTNDSIRCLISKLPLKTATGPDGISSWMLKATSSHIAPPPPLCHIFNLSISTGLVPLDWKSSFIVPIPKLSPS